MVKEIDPDRLPPDQKKAFDNWHAFFSAAVASGPFSPYDDFQGEDKNILALRSLPEFLSWYGQPPGPIQHPYRDECFYTRELSWLSAWCSPEVVVEFGTDKGVGTFILSRLNPKATVYTVDISDSSRLPDGSKAECGLFAKRNHQNIVFVRQDSKHYRSTSVDLCFIDGDHSEEGVWEDSVRAWMNRSGEKRWAIIWHDYREADEMRGLKRSIHKFSDLVRKHVYKFKDSATVWMTSEGV